MMAYRAVEPVYRDTRFVNPQSRFRSTLLCPRPSIYPSMTSTVSSSSQASNSRVVWPGLVVVILSESVERSLSEMGFMQISI